MWRDGSMKKKKIWGLFKFFTNPLSNNFFNFCKKIEKSEKIINIFRKKIFCRFFLPFWRYKTLSLTFWAFRMIFSDFLDFLIKII